LSDLKFWSQLPFAGKSLAAAPSGSPCAPSIGPPFFSLFSLGLSRFKPEIAGDQNHSTAVHKPTTPFYRTDLSCQSCLTHSPLLFFPRFAFASSL